MIRKQHPDMSRTGRRNASLDFGEARARQRIGRPPGGAGPRGGGAVALAMLLLSAGCGLFTPYYTVEVSSLATEAAVLAGRRYVLIPLDEGVDPESLQYREYAGQMEDVLAELGFIPAETVREADQLISLNYGVSGPKKNIGTTSVPVFGWTRMPRFHHPRPGIRGFRRAYGPPAYGLVGYTSQVYAYDTYTRVLQLSGRKINHGKKKSEPGETLWEVSAVSEGSNGDLRAIFPALSAAAKPFIGLDSGQSVRVLVDSEPGLRPGP